MDKMRFATKSHAACRGRHGKRLSCGLAILCGVVFAFSFSLRADPAPEAAASLRDGVPSAWLVGGVHDGRAGNEIYGVDVDKTIRPNPGEAYLSSQLMGGSIESWHEAAVTGNDGCVIMARRGCWSMWWGGPNRWKSKRVWRDSQSAPALFMC